MAKSLKTEDNTGGKRRQVIIMPMQFSGGETCDILEASTG
jgi:hypothetical protein